MSKSRKNLDPGQVSLFDLIERVSADQAAAATDISTEGKASIDAAIRAIITEALKRCPLSRYEVAAKMSVILGVSITKEQIDSWSAESKQKHRFPLVYVGAFCQAAGDFEIARYMAKLCGGYFIESKDALFLRLGRLEKRKEELASEEKIIRDMLRNGGGKE